MTKTLSVRYDKNGIRKPPIGVRIRRSKSSYLFLFPFMLLFFLFSVLPVLTALVLSFTDFNMVSFPSFVGLSNYTRMLLNDEVFITSIKNTMVFAVITGPVSYLLCLMLAWLVNEVGDKLRVIFTVIFYAPSLTGSAVTIWMYIFSGDSYGLINSLLMRMGWITDPIQWLIDPTYNLTIVIIVQLWLSLGAGFLSFIAGFKNIDRSIYEAGAIDGIRNRFQEFWYLTLSSMRPQLMFGAVMQIVSAFSVSSIPVTLTGFPSTNNSTTTILTHMMDVGSTRMESGYACAIATVLFLFMILARNVISAIIQSD